MPDGELMPPPPLLGGDTALLLPGEIRPVLAAPVPNVSDLLTVCTARRVCLHRAAEPASGTADLPP
jgi:hypothetical protein